MNCRAFLSWLREAAERGRLGIGPASLRPEAELHAASCARCAAALHAADQIERILSDPAGLLPQGFTDRVMARLALECAGETARPCRSRRPLPRLLSVRALLALFAFLAAVACAYVGAPLLGPAVLHAARDAAGALSQARPNARFAGQLIADDAMRSALVLMLLPSIALGSRALSRWVSGRIAGEQAARSGR